MSSRHSEGRVRVRFSSAIQNGGPPEWPTRIGLGYGSPPKYWTMYLHYKFQWKWRLWKRQNGMSCLNHSLNSWAAFVGSVQLPCSHYQTAFTVSISGGVFRGLVSPHLKWNSLLCSYLNTSENVGLHLKCTSWHPFHISKYAPAILDSKAAVVSRRKPPRNVISHKPPRNVWSHADRQKRKP